jgi:hypothetical protein
LSEYRCRQRPGPALVVEERGLAAHHPEDLAVATHPLHLDRTVVEPPLADLVQVRAELRAAVFVQGVEDRQPRQFPGVDPVQPSDLRVGVHRPTLEVEHPDAVREVSTMSRYSSERSMSSS